MLPRSAVFRPMCCRAWRTESQLPPDRLFKVLEGLGLEVLLVSREQALKLKDLAQQESE